MSVPPLSSAAEQRPIPRWIGDWLAPVVVGLLALAALGGPHAPTDPRSHALHVLSFFALIGLTVAMRHRNPLGALVVVAVVALVHVDGPAVVLPLLLALFGVARWGNPRRELILATALAAIALLVGPSLAIHGFLTFQEVLQRLVAVALAVAAGLYMSARRDRLEGLQERAVRLERERSLLADQAVADERVRIARELHDVVAHAVSLMVVQAQAVQATSAPEQRPALEGIADTGREALAEMHRMLGVLRTDEAAGAERTPAPGIRDIGALLERARSTGLQVSLDVNGEVRPLPAGVDLSAYRIAQEAITNVIKHARASRTDVALRYLPDALELSISDDGSGSAAAGAGGVGEADPPGHGLVGMRERVALFGGTLASGPSLEGGGYAVHAVLPL